jgi:diaminopimelate decarboxylase
VGAGSIKEMSTSAATSKFGIGIDGDIERIYNAYLERPWLNGIHVHVGSQGFSCFQI